MKHFYPRVLENKEPLFQLRALAGSDMCAGNVCHAVAPPGVGYTSPCHPLQRSKLGNEGCQVTAKFLVWLAESLVPSDYLVSGYLFCLQHHCVLCLQHHCALPL